MKNPILRGILCAAVCFLAACASTPSTYKKADKTAKGIDEFRSEIVDLKAAVDNAIASLSQTSESATTNPRQAFESFSKAVAGVEKARERAAKRAADIKSAGGAYFKQWEDQLAKIESEEIRNLAMQRREKLAEIFAGLGPVLQKASADFDPFYTSLRDLRTFLGADLTVGTIDAAKDLIHKTREEGIRVQASLSTLIDEMNSIAAQITPAKAEAKPAQ